MSNFLVSFKVIGLGTLEIFLLGLTGFFLVQRKMLGKVCISTLSTLVINVTLPCLIFTSVVTRFSTEKYPSWWIYPICAILLMCAASMFGLIITKFNKNLAEKREYISLFTFNNANYLPIPLIAAMFPKEQAETYFVYVFLFLLGFIPFMASFGVMLAAGKKFNKENIKDIFNPPLFAILSSLFIAYFGLTSYIPNILLNPMKLLGACTVPLAMIILGGIICLNFSNKLKISPKIVIELALVKLILLPLIAFFIVKNFPVNFRSLGFIIMLQAAMPPATSLTAISEKFGGNSAFIGQVTFYIYIISLFTIPVMMGLYMYFVGL
ncbi:AEC family transporter [bacterium]